MVVAGSRFTVATRRTQLTPTAADVILLPRNLPARFLVDVHTVLFSYIVVVTVQDSMQYKTR